ncbi:CHS1 [Mytilus edulis]|uniref:chitin synthase n=1 Tax=Mytilus edulis TaxID=6550 RepID=A0A8S3Q434_MYTED|nr:CHS1 [Mytilus edulis]
MSNMAEPTAGTSNKSNKETSNKDAESTEEQNNSKLKGSVCPQAEKILKVAFAIFLFILTFASGFIGRITLHILIWHINPPIESNVSTINTLGGILEPNCACISGTPCIGTSHNTAVDESWIWALFLVVIAPYCLTFMSTFSRICFKSNKELDWRVLMVLIGIETLHSVGLSIMGFIVLPAFDPASASVVYLAVCGILPILDLIDKMAIQLKRKSSKTLNQQTSKGTNSESNCQNPSDKTKEQPPQETDSKATDTTKTNEQTTNGTSSESNRQNPSDQTEEQTSYGTDNEATDTKKTNEQTTNGTSSESKRQNPSDETKNQPSSRTENETIRQQTTAGDNLKNENKTGEISREGTASKEDNFHSAFIICNETSKLSFALPFAGLILHVAGVILIMIYINIGTMIALFLLSVLLISIKYWENFISMGTHESKFACRLKRELHTRRTKTSCILSFWKILITFCAVIVVFVSRGSDSMATLKALFNNGTTIMNTVFGEQQFGFNPVCQTNVPFLTAFICIMCNYLCYKASKTVCVINCQRFCFSLPIVMLLPVVTIVMGGLMNQPDVLKLDSCDLLFSDWCIIDSSRLSKNCSELLAAFIVLFLSILLITRHIWKTNGRKNGETARIFVSPFYCGIFTELSLLLNRRRDDDEYDIVHREKKSSQDKRKGECSMPVLVTSILRLDMRQSINKFMEEDLKEDVETFDLEAHVFFDDAFEPTTDTQSQRREMNIYVKTFIRELSFATWDFYEKQIELPDGGMLKTPYGARIEWTLPGENKMFIHLKDKTKVRNKKRWSQVMYMLYILKWKIPQILNPERGYNSSKTKSKKEKLHEKKEKLDKKKEKLEKKSELEKKELLEKKKQKKKQIQEIAEKTFLLALDGDVDFEPEAVLSLMRRMEKNDKVGAACGRIHPIGNGPMVWYQQFEYAISHWLQKATEHVIGCVLCSPGCFSLFRGSAILQHEVLETYTSVAQEARQCLQYDQGEDRWLCTLLLQKGWKIEYCAESDSHTFAPESFNEFYTQRRRWTPSTMANILEIIQDWKNVTKNNENISFLYIVYQFILFVSTILTPGTIFMIILGALIVGFETIPPWLALILNLIPVIVFILMCLYTSTERQLQMAAVLSCIYVIVMVVVMIGVVRDAILEGFYSSPKGDPMHTSWSAIFLAIPSMSMLMFLFSIGNLHVTSWGTRDTETKKKPDGKGNTDQIKDKQDAGYLCSFGKLVCCAISNSKDSTNDERTNEEQPQTPKVDDTNKKSSLNNGMHGRTNMEDTFDYIVDENVPNISEKETIFWEKKIEQYLKPHNEEDKFTNEQEKKLKHELVELRNTVCLFVYLSNAVLVTVMFGLTQVNAFKSSLTAEFECGGENISIVPIAILFSAVFGFLLLIQFSCMLYHRFSTLVHITANTDLRSTENEHIAEIMNNIIKQSIKRSKDGPADVSDKCRNFLDRNRSVHEAKEKTCTKFRDLIFKNRDKLKIVSIKPSYSKDKEIHEKVKAKWQLILKPKFRDIVSIAVEQEKEKAKEVRKRSSTAEPKTNQVCPESSNDLSESTCNQTVNTDSNV